MTDTDVKKLAKAVDERLKPLFGEIAKVKQGQFMQYSEVQRIGKDIARIDSQLENLNDGQKENTRIIKILWDQTGQVLAELEDIKEMQVNHTKFLTSIDEKVEKESDDTQKLSKRLTEVEDNLGIVAPSELTVV